MQQLCFSLTILWHCLSLRFESKLIFSSPVARAEFPKCAGTLSAGFWTWNSNTLTTWYQELTYWKRLWHWEVLAAGGEGDNWRWDGSMDMSLSELGELLMDREAWPAAIHGVSKSQTRLSVWTELNFKSQTNLLINVTLKVLSGSQDIWNINISHLKKMTF